MVFEQNWFHLEKEIVALVVLVSVAFHEVIMVVVLIAAVMEVVLVLSKCWDYHTVIVVDSTVKFRP